MQNKSVQRGNKSKTPSGIILKKGCVPSFPNRPFIRIDIREVTVLLARRRKTRSQKVGFHLVHELRFSSYARLAGHYFIHAIVVIGVLFQAGCLHNRRGRLFYKCLAFEDSGAVEAAVKYKSTVTAITTATFSGHVRGFEHPKYLRISSPKNIIITLCWSARMPQKSGAESVLPTTWILDLASSASRAPNFQRRETSSMPAGMGSCDNHSPRTLSTW